jgi:hypothetical protein
MVLRKAQSTRGGGKGYRRDGKVVVETGGGDELLHGSLMLAESCVDEAHSCEYF